MTMEFAKASDGFRGYTTPILDSGLPRTGLAVGDFALVVRNPQNTAEYTDVSGIVELGGTAVGTYVFTIPSSFFATHGAGNYLVRLTVDTYAVGGSGPPSFRGTSPVVLQVTANDIDDLASAALVTEIWQRLGLDSANPMATSNTQITVGGITIAIADVAGVVTLTRAP